jgi:hypothetical protein
MNEIMKTKKTILRVLLLLFVATTLITACKKGEAGPQGEKGTQGIQGIAGPDGSTILSGNSAPVSTVGKTGDFYIDLNTSNLYGPKTANGWGSALGLKGATGSSGKGVLSGTGIPAASLGTDGDFYVDKTTFNFYGPKTAGNWGTPTALVGPQGPMGNANVKIDIFTVKTTDWKINGLMSTAITPNGYSVVFTKYFERSAAALTDDFINGNGLVMVYGELTSYSFLPLPYSVNDSGTPNTFFWDYRVVPGKIVLHSGFKNTTIQDVRQQVNDLSVPEAKYKIVLMTGTIVANLNAAKIDKNDKNAVAKYLGLITNTLK